MKAYINSENLDFVGSFSKGDDIQKTFPKKKLCLDSNVCEKFNLEYCNTFSMIKNWRLI